MSSIDLLPKIQIAGRAVDYTEASYAHPGGMGAATLSFKISATAQGNRRLWNEEVTLYLHESDATPIFRGWIKRSNPTFNDLSIIAEDGFGYMIKGGEAEKAKIVLDNEDNIDGLTLGAAIPLLLKKAKLDDKIKTDFIGDTSPTTKSISPPIRGVTTVLDVIKTMLAKVINTSGTLPRPNIIRLIDDGVNSQLVIELESDLETDQIQMSFSDNINIIDLNITERKIPTLIVVNGRGGVKGTFTHDTAIAAFDRNYLELTNENLESPADCKNFAIKIFEANLTNQYEYGLKVSEGAYLEQNDVVRIKTDNKDYSGNYRIIGKKINLGPNGFDIGLSINKKPPTLAEYFNSRDN
tara:strand:+ start:11540 stop:12598 length:1059 start_codon:yes stop_codon:yes gene_type:complete